MATIPKFVTGTPKRKESVEVFGALTYADTTAVELFRLPKGAQIVGIYVIGSAVSNAVTTATIGIGSTTAANEYLASYDVKTAATGEGYNPAGAAAVGSALNTKLTADTVVYGKYADTGGAGTAGSWVVKLEYVVLGPNESITS